MLLKCHPCHVLSIAINEKTEQTPTTEFLVLSIAINGKTEQTPTTEFLECKGKSLKLGWHNVLKTLKPSTNANSRTDTVMPAKIPRVKLTTTYSNSSMFEFFFSILIFLNIDEDKKFKNGIGAVVPVLNQKPTCPWSCPGRRSEMLKYL